MWLGDYNICKILKILYIIKKSDLQNLVSIWFLCIFDLYKAFDFIHVVFLCVSYLACSRYLVMPQSWHVWCAIISLLSPLQNRGVEYSRKKLPGTVRRLWFWGRAGIKGRFILLGVCKFGGMKNCIIT